MTNDPQGHDKSLPPTSLKLYSTTSLEKDHANLLPPLTSLINLCYSVGHTSNPNGVLLPYSYQRLLTDTSLIGEVGKDGFVLVLLSQESGREAQPIASASAKPFKPLEHNELIHSSELLGHFKRRAAPLPTVSTPSKPGPATEPNGALSNLPETADDPSQWEIVCNVVHPDYQKRGIAAQMFDAVVQEIRKRKSKSDKIHFVITTMKEINETYYQKRGFVTTKEQRFEKGVGGSEVGFSVVEMERTM
ncbi:MAG: hypothetical protein Q9170_007704 [Blastenia crenularia]